MNLRDLKHKRMQAVQAMRAIVERAESEKWSELTAEERAAFDAASAEIDSLAEDIKRLEKLDEQRALEAAAEGAAENAAEQRAAEQAQQPAQQRATQTAERPAIAALRRYMLGGPHALNAEQRTLLRFGEQRDLQADVDVSGGFAYPDEQFVMELIDAVKDAAVMRPLCRTFQVRGADSLGAPKLDARPSSFTWGTELQVATADTTMAFGKRELRPHDATVQLKVSMKLLRQSGMMESLVREELAYEVAQGEEDGFLTGTGAGQPLGVFIASNDGISTGRDVSTGNTGTAIGADGLINAKHAIKSNYWPRLRWIFHRDGLSQIRKLKDGNGQYLWMPGISGGLGDRIVDVPYVLSENAPNTFTTGLYVGIIGDFSKYWIADQLDFSLQRLEELYAATSQVGFIGRLAVDGMPILEEAFARVKLG